MGVDRTDPNRGPARRFRRLALAAAASAAAGCGSTAVERQVTHAALAGDAVTVNVYAATVRWGSHGPIESTDPHAYTATVPLAAGVVSRIADGPYVGGRPAPWDGQGPLAPSVDGRFVAVVADGRVFDAATAAAVDDPAAAEMFRVAARLDPGPAATYLLTQHLGFLLVRLSERDRAGNDHFTAGGVSHLRGDHLGGNSAATGSCYAVIDRRTGRVAAAAECVAGDELDGLVDDPSSSVADVPEAGESADGRLLLLYRGVIAGKPPAADRCRYTLRGADGAVRYEVTVPADMLPPGASSGWGASLDAAGHRVLLYDHVGGAALGRPVPVQIWDYLAGTVQMHWLDLRAAADHP